MEPPPSHNAHVNRTMSVKSRAAVNTVGHLKAKFGHLEDRLREAVEVISDESSTVQELLKAKLDLAQISGMIEKFQFDEVDAVVTHHLDTGKDEVRQQRKDLTDAVTALGDEVLARHREATELLAARSDSGKAGGASGGVDGMGSRR